MTEAFERKLDDYKNKISKEIDEIPFKMDMINEKPCKVIVEDNYDDMIFNVNLLTHDMIRDTCDFIDNMKKESKEEYDHDMECLIANYKRLKRELKDLRYCEQFCHLHRADFDEWKAGKEKRDNIDEIREEMQYRREMKSNDNEVRESNEERRREKLMALFD